MPFKKKYQQQGLDTSQMVGGYMKVGSHTVTITAIADLDTTLRIKLENQYGDTHSDTVFIASKTKEGYSQRMTDLLTSLPTELMQRVVEEEAFDLLVGTKLRATLARGDGHFIVKVDGGFEIRGGIEIVKAVTYAEAKQRLDMLGNKAYVRVVGYAPLEKKTESKGVW